MDLDVHDRYVLAMAPIQGNDTLLQISQIPRIVDLHPLTVKAQDGI